MHLWIRFRQQKELEEFHMDEQSQYTTFQIIGINCICCFLSPSQDSLVGKNCMPLKGEDW